MNKYSGYQITTDDCKLLLNDCDMYLSPSSLSYAWISYWPLILTILMGACLLVYYVMFSEYCKADPNNSMKTTGVLLGVYMIGVLGLLVILGTAINSHSRVKMYITRLDDFKKAIFNRHPATTFCDRPGLVLDITAFYGVIFINYNWYQIEKKMTQLHNQGQSMQNIEPSKEDMTKASKYADVN